LGVRKAEFTEKFNNGFFMKILYPKTSTGNWDSQQSDQRTG